MSVIDWRLALKANVPGLHPGQEALDSADAAVLMAFTDQADPELVLTKRSETLSSHAGEVAFPGGKRDQTDADVLVTALRESYEEINLPPQLVELVGPMSISISKMGLKVVPVVGIIPVAAEFIPSEAEIDSIFKVPLSYFIKAPPQDFNVKKFRGIYYEVPCYRFNDYEIWGLTAYLIWDCCNRVFDTGFELAVPRPTDKPS